MKFIVCLLAVSFGISFSSCSSVEKAGSSVVSTIGSFFGGVPSPAQVTSDVQGFVKIADDAALAADIFYPQATADVNDYVASASAYLQKLNSALQAGTAALPTPTEIQSDLNSLAAEFGSPAWATDLNASLVADYTKVYNKAVASSVVAQSYISAVIAGL